MEINETIIQYLKRAKLLHKKTNKLRIFKKRKENGIGLVNLVNRQEDIICEMHRKFSMGLTKKHRIIFQSCSENKTIIWKNFHKIKETYNKNVNINNKAEDRLVC